MSRSRSTPPEAGSGVSSADTAPARIGQSVERVEGALKVTGAARYTADHPIPHLVFAAAAGAPSAPGRLAALDTTEAERTPGVLAVFTHRNRPPLFLPRVAPERLLALDGEEIHYAGQLVALIVAESREAAREAAGRVRVEVAQEPPRVALEAGLGAAFRPKSGGTGLDGRRLAKGVRDLDAALAAAAVRVEAVYRTPIEHHNPLEPHATTAVWDGARLTLYDSTQGVQAARDSVAASLGIEAEQVRVVCPFVGGGFGCKGETWMHSALAAMAARAVGRPVQLVLDRRQMFELVGHRPATHQTVALGADRSGRLVAVRHRSVNHSSPVGEFVEPSAGISSMLYAAPNAEWEHRLVDLTVGAPTWARGPGEVPGSFALESAMDELAAVLGMDPIALRLANHAERDPASGLLYSGKHLKECYALGAERFGWSRRPAAPGTQRDGDWRVGQGMASALFPAFRARAAARVRLLPDGSAEVASATHDLGTGMSTIMSQTAAEVLGLPIDRVRSYLGDSALPDAPVAGGSLSTASVLPAVQEAARRALACAVSFATGDRRSPLAGLDPGEVVLQDGRLTARSDPARGETLAALCARQKRPAVEAMAESAPGEDGEDGEGDDLWELHSFGAHFVEVGVHAWTAEVRVRRVVSVMDVGRVINPMTARSQVVGGVVWGIGMALLEESRIDPATARVVTASLADYRVPVHADVPEIEVHFIDEPDFRCNPLGARGVGEIGTTGVAAALANAVHHATGRRVRELPITPDKLL